MTTSPVLLACYFGAKREIDGQYDRMARVLAYTAQQHCSGWTIRVEAISTASMPRAASGNPSHEWNTLKLDWWIDQLDDLPDGARVVLMDADMTIVRPLDALWDQSFDLAYTVRGDTSALRIPFNGGFLALRLSPAVRAAMRRYRDENARMIVDRAHHMLWRRKYAGINQAAFGLLLETGGLALLEVVTLACQEWNCCDWQTYTADTRLVHYKSGLRRATFGMSPATSVLRPLVKEWHALEARALAADRRRA